MGGGGQERARVSTLKKKKSIIGKTEWSILKTKTIFYFTGNTPSRRRTTAMERKEQNREKCRKFREKLKANPAKYQDHRSMETTRLQNFRKAITSEQRAQMNEIARHRNQAKRYIIILIIIIIDSFSKAQFPKS